MKASKKDIYGTRGVAASGGSGDKLSESFRSVFELTLESQGTERTAQLLERLAHELRSAPRPSGGQNTPYLNTIPVEQQPTYPGDRDIERRIKSIMRWNAMAMVVKANSTTNVGGHIASFASSATLYEVAQNHFFRGATENFPGDMVYFQGHAAPGMYARAYMEGRLDEKDLQNFRQELAAGGGLSSYPHPYLMPEFWQFPTVSMGLGPIMSLYQARFNRYLQARGLTNWKSEPKVWAFLGDGESDEPESLGAITLAARENLDNIVWVVNCNLQRLDGPVRGNGKIIQELEGLFRGAGWNVIKVIWGGAWDEIIARDKSGLLLKRMEECVDGDYQKYVVEPGSYTRKHFFGKYPELLELVNHLSDEQISKLLRGGHDVRKMYAAYKAATEHKGQPTVVLAKTVKGYGLGEAGEGKNISHQQKKMNEKELREFRRRLSVKTQCLARQRDAFVKPHALLHPILMPRLPAPIWLRLTRMAGFGNGRHAAADRLDDFIRLDEKLQLHLLELARAEGEIARRDLVAKRLADLRNAERDFLPRSLQHVLELRENRLRGFRAEIGDVLVRFERPTMRLEHQVEGPRLGLLAVAGVHHLAWFLRAGNFVGLVGAETALARFAVNHRIGERRHMP